MLIQIVIKVCICNSDLYCHYLAFHAEKIVNICTCHGLFQARHLFPPMSVYLTISALKDSCFIHGNCIFHLNIKNMMKEVHRWPLVGGNRVNCSDGITWRRSTRSIRVVDCVWRTSGRARSWMGFRLMRLWSKRHRQAEAFRIVLVGGRSRYWLVTCFASQESCWMRYWWIMHLLNNPLNHSGWRICMLLRYVQCK
jgi:hypothetical protein